MTTHYLKTSQHNKLYVTITKQRVRPTQRIFTVVNKKKTQHLHAFHQIKTSEEFE